ncbi:hypothetical protein DICA3_C20758 [Diutina catenulata]
MSKSSRAIAKVLPAFSRPPKWGFDLFHTVGPQKSRQFNPFMVVDHFYLKPGNKGGFPPHPHAGIETVTYMLSGCMAHEDFKGHNGMVFPGDLQFMNSGNGIMHTEMPVENDLVPVEGLQLWLALPEPINEAPPSYTNLKSWDVPEAKTEDGLVVAKIISGNALGIEKNRKLAQIPLDFYHFTVQPGGYLEQQVKPGWNYFLYNFSAGKVNVGREAFEVGPRDNALLAEEGDYVSLGNVGEEQVQFVLVGGPKIENQKTLHMGGFIGPSNEYLRKAENDFQNSKNAFAPRTSWKPIIAEGVPEEFMKKEYQVRDEMEAAKSKKSKHSPITDALFLTLLP